MRNIFLVLVLSAVASLSHALLIEGRESGGGQGDVAEFVRLASYGIESLSRQGDLMIHSRKVDLGIIGRSLVSAKVQFTTKSLSLNGKKVSAINDPATGTITVNTKDWRAFNDTTKLQLTFHELWGLGFHDHADDQYQFSVQMVEKVRSAGFVNPARVIALQTNLQNGRGQTFRAMVVRQGGESRSNLAVIFQKLQAVNEDLDIVTSQVVYNPSELSYGKDSTVENLRLAYTKDGEAFSFEVDSMADIVTKLTCSFILPEPPASVEIIKQVLSCVPKN